MKYEDCTPIRDRPCSAWQIDLPNGIRKCALFKAGATFDEVHQYCLVHHGEFELSQLTCGEFTMSFGPGDSTYKADSRAFDHNRETVSTAARAG